MSEFAFFRYKLHINIQCHDALEKTLQKYKEFVKKDIDLGLSFGFQETPSFVIVNSKDGSNPEVLQGAHPFPSFKAIIDRKLSEVQNSN